SISEAGCACCENGFERKTVPLAAGLARDASGRLDAGGEVRAGVVRRRSFELLDGGSFRPAALLFIDLDLVGHRQPRHLEGEAVGSGWDCSRARAHAVAGPSNHELAEAGDNLPDAADVDAC